MCSKENFKQMNPDAFHVVFDIKVEWSCREEKLHLINFFFFFLQIDLFLTTFFSIHVWLLQGVHEVISSFETWFNYFWKSLTVEIKL